MKDLPSYLPLGFRGSDRSYQALCPLLPGGSSDDSGVRSQAHTELPWDLGGCAAPGGSGQGHGVQRWEAAGPSLARVWTSSDGWSEGQKEQDVPAGC